ncbi:hypothetical protein [Streptomyces subrutilus]|uniref:Uncharacterized protein n=1 Tax=Streptomyces subrutilus TaxID=36818 RepID=A0A5P2UYK6_9ACTN|nr:hypothetical protein [Streptomyces subrutilus]QEU82591.1 hypothetical protein CP968_33990 [Streptomyces subrutilus]
MICLLRVPGAAAGVPELFVRGHRGPETVLALELDGPPDAAAAAAVRAAAGAGAGGGPHGPGRLLLCGHGPAAGAAYALARALAGAHRAPGSGGGAVGVVLTGLAGPGDSARALARGLAASTSVRP